MEPLKKVGNQNLPPIKKLSDIGQLDSIKCLQVAPKALNNIKAGDTIQIKKNLL